MEKLFAVVVFTDEESVSAVPNSWIVEENGKKLCYYPPFKSDSKITKAAAANVDFEATWTPYPVRVLNSYSKS